MRNLKEDEAWVIVYPKYKRLKYIKHTCSSRRREAWDKACRGTVGEFKQTLKRHLGAKAIRVRLVPMEGQLP